MTPETLNLAKRFAVMSLVNYGMTETIQNVSAQYGISHVEAEQVVSSVHSASQTTVQSEVAVATNATDTSDDFAEHTETEKADFSVKNEPSFTERAAIAVKYQIPVIPISIMDKDPAGIGAKSASLDADQIAIWSQERPDANSGFVAQAKLGGKLILDFDDQTVLDSIIKDTGRTLPDSLTVKSGSPAAYGHIYFNQTEESLNRLKNFAVVKNGKEAFSCRWNNEYCVGPLSVYPGKGEQQINRFALYEIINDSPCTDIPTWLIDWLVGQMERQDETIKSVADSNDVIPEGMRVNVMCRLAGKGRASGDNYDELLKKLNRINEERCTPSLPESKIQDIAQQYAGYPDGVANIINTGVEFKTPSSPGSAVALNEWPIPQLLDDVLSPVLPFKEDFLPVSIRPWVTDVTERMGVSFDFTGVCALITIAGMVGRRAFVYPKKLDKEWHESICLSGAVIARSGGKKTPTWKAFLNPIDDINSEWLKDYEKLMEDFKRVKASWDKKSNSTIGTTDAEPKAPACRKVKINDSTPEKLQEILRDNPEGLLYYRDELSSWATELHKKGYENQRGLFLAAMNGNDVYGIERIGRGTVGAVMCASLFGGFQPELLRKFFTDTTNVSDGLIPRFTFLVWPDEQMKDDIDRPADQRAKESFKQICRNLAQFKSESIGLHFSPESQDIYNEWSRNLDKKVRNERNLGKQSHLSKYEGALPRIAGLLQLIDLTAVLGAGVGGSHVIDAEHTRQAIQLIAYLESHMNRVYDSIRSPIQTAEMVIAEHIKDGTLSESFSLRDIKRRHWGNIKDNEIIDTALETLERKNWVRSSETPAGRSGGRPTVRWEVNPKIAVQPK